jgi:mono/diheme cytochrome c family protein
LVPFILALLFTFQVIRTPFPTDMQESPALGYQEAPRLTVPEAAVPIQGESVIPDEFPLNPIPADDISRQRGQILYQIHCALCHGESGRGDGPLASYFSRTPQDLGSSKTAAEFDGSVYLAIQQGFGEMPSLIENLTPRERWDVINFTRMLTTSDE